MLSEWTVHATLPVSDLDTARRFYEGTLGFKAFEENEEGVFYRAADQTFFALYPSSYAGANPGTGAVFFVQDVEAEVDQLRSKGILFDEYDLPEFKTENGIASLDLYKAAWFRDPDGNILGVFEKKY